jgi:hypothetical protein
MEPLGHGASGPELGGGTTPPPSPAAASPAVASPAVASPASKFEPASAWPPEELAAPELPERAPEEEPLAPDPLEDDPAGRGPDPSPLSSLGVHVEDCPHAAGIKASIVSATAATRRMSGASAERAFATHVPDGNTEKSDSSARRLSRGGDSVSSKGDGSLRAHGLQACHQSSEDW